MLQFYIPKNFNSWFGCTQLYWLSYLCLFYLIEAKTVVITTLNSLHHLVSSIKEETKKTKDIMYHSIKDYIELSLHLFSVYISQSGWSIYIYIWQQWIFIHSIQWQWLFIADLQVGLVALKVKVWILEGYSFCSLWNLSYPWVLRWQFITLTLWYFIIGVGLWYRVATQTKFHLSWRVKSLTSCSALSPRQHAYSDQWRI